MENNNNDDDRREIDKKRFRLDTTVNIAHILTTVGMMIALFSWGADVKTALSNHSIEINNIKTERDRVYAETRESLTQINSKIDRLIERRDKN